MHPQLLLLASAFLSLVSASCVHNTFLKPRDAHGKVPISNFGYTGITGPFNWASLDPENIACSTSNVQSPINIDTHLNTTTVLKNPPRIHFPAVESAEFENLGTTIEVIASGITTINEDPFSLKQFHFHTPSEHRIDEEYFPLEMHMVHEGADGKIFVLAVLFELSSSSSTELLKSVTKNIDHISVPGTKTETGALDFSELKKLIDTSKLFSYQGSLTTPPCAEGLTFIIPQTPMALDVETYNAIKKTVKFNSRFTQNGAGQANVLDPGCKANNGTVLHPNPSNSTTASSTASPPAQTAESVSGDGPDCKKNIQRVKRNRWARF